MATWGINYLDDFKMKQSEVVNITGIKIPKLVKLISKNKDKGECLVYLDPPYYPIAKTKGGKVSPYKLYNNDFTPVDFLKLKDHCDELTLRGIPFVLSNSNCEFIRRLFKDYVMVGILEPRVMKSGKGKGSRLSEDCLLITNFKNKKDFMRNVKNFNDNQKEN